MIKCTIFYPTYLITAKRYMTSEGTVGKVRLEQLWNLVAMQLTEILNRNCVIVLYI